ncbi:MAG: helix-turn-helix transcriptional regulator [Clostridia bacterium]|nr:helix-turn-helix transcriptional regulator [Clostridia bacterium]
MNSNFPRTLSLLRKEKKISQRNAAKELGVSQAVLSHYENGVREPGLDFVAKAADFYHVTTDFLLGRTMSRDDFTIRAEDIPDISQNKDNVLSGDMSLLLNKKLLVNSCGLIFDLLGRADDRELISDTAMYLSNALYKIFRTLYCEKGVQEEEFFSVPQDVWSYLSDSEMKLCEMRIKKAIKKSDLPEITQEFLEREHPELLQSLLSVLQTVGKRLNEHI